MHEDDKIMSHICEEIRCEAAIDGTAIEIARYWSGSFSSRCLRARGDSFIAQRQVGMTSLRETIDHFQIAS